MYYLTWIAKNFVTQLAYSSVINGDIQGINPATPNYHCI